MLEVRVETEADYRAVEELTRETFLMFTCQAVKSTLCYINSVIKITL